eukprot:1175513-Lingulodinium_polyedra.AAC.1
MDFVIVFADNRYFLPLTMPEAKVATYPCEDMLVRDGVLQYQGDQQLMRRIEPKWLRTDMMQDDDCAD